MALALERYFTRIAWTGPRDATAATLAGLIRHHTRAIPFENLDILLGKGIRIDLDSIQAKLVEQRRGGYCFEQNALFAAVLGELGFRVTTLAARVRLGVPPDVATPRSHMLLRVDLDSGPMLADVGFGFTPTSPLVMQPGLEQPLELDTYRLLEDAGLWTLQLRQADGWGDAYRFNLEPWLPIDYEVANHFTSTHPRSHFTQGPILVRSDGLERVRHIYRARELTTRRPGAEPDKRTIDDLDELLAILSRDFHIDLPPGTRF